MPFSIFRVSLLICLSLSACSAPSPSPSYLTWQHYLGDQARTHFSDLDQINRENVKQLRVAWEYHSEDQGPGTKSQFNPLVVGRRVYLLTPGLRVVALDGSTGAELWAFDPSSELDYNGFTRGLHYWAEGEDQRILFAARDFLYALDAQTGSPVVSFGQQGKVDLREGLGRDTRGVSLNVTSPGAVYRDLIILGFQTNEGLPAVPGAIRAFDVRSGAQKWIFHLLPEPGEFGYDTWPEAAYTYSGGANNWCGMSLDEERGIVYVPTGSAAADFWGGDRHGENLFANCLVALNAQTGERIWHFQTVHHDLWDRDLPAPPNLLRIKHEGKHREVVAQITKSGHVYVLDRDTGEPLFPVEEQPYPASDLYGEQAWPSQPLPLKPAPFSRQTLTESDINPHSVDYDSLVARLREVNSQGQFFPPSTQGTVIFPGFDGGGEWGGAGVDPYRGILYINANEMPWILTMVDIRGQSGNNAFERGKKVYQNFCMACHGADLQGTVYHGNAPALLNLQDHMDADSLTHVLQYGRNSMPAFGFLEAGDVQAITAFLMEDKASELSGDEVIEGANVSPYAHTGYNRFVDSEGYPAVKPPWGTLNALDLNTGEYLWRVPLGEHEALSARGIPKTGTENYGGPVVTAGKLIFIGATKDKRVRAFDTETGAELWSHQLPSQAMATPATYAIDGKQYVVFSAAGSKLSREPADLFVAFALEE